MTSDPLFDDICQAIHSYGDPRTPGWRNSKYRDQTELMAKAVLKVLGRIEYVEEGVTMLCVDEHGNGVDSFDGPFRVLLPEVDEGG